MYSFIMATRRRVELSSEQIATFKSIFKDRFVTTESVLDEHGRDESAFPPVMPSAVIYATSTVEVSQVMKMCFEQNIPVVPFGAGTSLEGHVLPIFGGISLDISMMNKILDITPEDLLVRVQGGVRRVALNEKLANSGLFFSVDPGADATLGGMASTGASGTTTVKYGSMRENVLAMTVVMSDGTIINTGRPTRKLSAGYDLTRLIVGSEGTLGIITELTLRIFGIPEKMSAAVVRFERLEDGVKAAATIVQMGTNIARCEFLDIASVESVNKHSNLNLPLKPTLFFEFHGSQVSVENDAQIVKEIVSEFNGFDFEWTSDESSRRKLWQARHDLYWSNLHNNPGKRVVSTDMAVPLSRLADAVETCEKILSKTRFKFCIFGHVADGNFHCTIITDPNFPEELQEIRALTHSMNSAIIAMNGTCTGEHGIGLGKIEALVEEAGQTGVDTMIKIKNVLDPKNILNPGKVLKVQ
jgi:D-lactate dehydrogenase (cytochrome)